VDGGPGNDTIIGGDGDVVLPSFDVVTRQGLLGGGGNDTTPGGRSADVLVGGNGDDMFIELRAAGEGPTGRSVFTSTAAKTTPRSTGLTALRTARRITSITS
jgi:Ca2+-binding RTX toxin-like protein